MAKYMNEEGLNDIIDNIIENGNTQAKAELARLCNGNEAILTRLAEDKDDNVRYNAAHFCKGNEKVLEKLINDKNENVVIAAINNCEVNEALLLKAAEDTRWTVLRSVINNAKGNEAVLTKVNMNPSYDDDLRKAIIQSGHNLIENSESKSWKIRSEVARYCDATKPEHKSILLKLSKDSSCQVRMEVALHSRGDTDILKPLVHDKNDDVRYVVARNCYGNSEILHAMADDPHISVVVEIAKQCDNCPDLIEKLANHKDHFVRELAISRCNGDEKILAAHYDDPDKSVRYAVAQQCKGNEPFIQSLINDDYKLVKLELLHKDLDLTDLISLTKDENVEVRSQAFIRAIETVGGLSEEIKKCLIMEEMDIVRENVALCTENIIGKEAAEWIKHPNDNPDFKSQTPKETSKNKNAVERD